MATDNSTETIPNIVPVSRRRFLSGTARVLATAGVVILPQQSLALDKPHSLEQMSPAPRDDWYYKVAEILDVSSATEDEIRRTIITFEDFRDSNNLGIRVLRDELADRQIRGGAS